MVSQHRRTPLVFVPGHGRTSETGSYSYTKLMDVCADVGFSPYFAPVDWESNRVDSWKQNVWDTIHDVTQPDEPIVLGGFSFGAAMAASMATELQRRRDAPRVVGVALASLSPIFKELFVHKPSSIGEAYPERLKAQFCDLPMPKLDMPVQLYIGSEEAAAVGMQTGMALAHFPHATLHIAEGAAHDVLHPAYLEAVAANIGALSLE